MDRGKFITIEGIEGVGKSTNIEAIKKELDAHDISYVLTREPGGTLLAEKIRDLLLKESDEAPVELSELLLVFAARAQHLKKIIIPALNRGDWVICDRFTDATYAYQGGGRGLSTSVISELESLVQGELRPDFTIILDLDPDIGLGRARNRGELDRFENEEKIFFGKVRRAYLDIAVQFPDRCYVVNAANDIDQVSTDILTELRNRILS